MFDETMKSLFDEVDHHIEDHYGHLYDLHPVRPARGATANPEADGLFNVGVNFTPGFGSKLGRGYIIEVKMATLDKVCEEDRRIIYEATAAKVRELLPVYFPDRDLGVEWCDIQRFKILGNFTLGKI